MESVTVKFQEDVLAKIDQSIARNNYASRTEFIREAVRDKLAELSRDELVKEFMKFRGSAKKTTTYEERRRTREVVSKQIMEKFEKQLK